MPNRPPRLKLLIGDRRDRRSASPSPSPEEAAAVVAALERFIRATAPSAGGPAQVSDPWGHTALLEAVERESQGDLSDPWLAA